jgi:uncharacterized membrane protein YgcG
MKVAGREMTAIRRALFIAIATFIFFAPSVLAVDTIKLTGKVTDNAHRLGDTGGILAAIDSLRNSQNVDVYVATTGSLNGTDPATFASSTASANSLPSRAALILVSFDDRKDAIWTGDGLSITPSELTAVRSGTLEAGLKSGQFAKAITDTVAALGRADTNTEPAAPTVGPSSNPVSLPLAAIFMGIVILCSAIAVLILGYVAFRWGKARLARRREVAQQRKRVVELARNANAALVTADETVRTARQEVDFVSAEFGDAETTSIRAVLSDIEQALKDAFVIGQKIDDDIPETLSESESMLAKVISLTTSVAHGYDEIKVHADDLRNLEKSAGEAIATARTLVATTQKRVDTSRSAFARLEKYAKSATSGIVNNNDAADAQLKAALADLDAAQKEFDSGERGPAAVHVRTAQASISKAKELTDAVIDLDAALTDAQGKYEAEFKTAQAEIDKAAAVVKKMSVPGLEKLVAQATETLQSAETEMKSDNPDVLYAYRQALAANEIADEALAGARTEEEKRQRAIDSAKGNIAAAEVSMQQADSYIKSHRSDVGRTARNRLSEARRKWEQVESSRTTDLLGAAQIALLVDQLADQSYSQARTDVNTAEDARNYQVSSSSYGSSSGGGYSSSSNSSGGSYDSSSSGGGWSNNGGFSSGGSFGGGSSGGSFGGGGGGSSSGGSW